MSDQPTRKDYEAIIRNVAKDACGDCIDTPCSYCGPRGTLTRFGRSLVAEVLKKQRQQQKQAHHG